MNQGRYIFSQLCDFLPVDHFKWLVKKYEGNKYVKSFTCWNHLLVLLFGQLSNRDGLRDLIVTLAPFKSAFHHLGFGKSVTRSNLSKANEIREVRIFQEFADRMVAIARKKRDGIKDFSYPTMCTHLTHQRYPCAFLSFGGQSSIMARGALSFMSYMMLRQTYQPSLSLPMRACMTRR